MAPSILPTEHIHHAGTPAAHLPRLANPLVPIFYTPLIQPYLAFPTPPLMPIPEFTLPLTVGSPSGTITLLHATSPPIPTLTTHPRSVQKLGEESNSDFEPLRLGE